MCSLLYLYLLKLTANITVCFDCSNNKNERCFICPSLELKCLESSLSPHRSLVSSSIHGSLVSLAWVSQQTTFPFIVFPALTWFFSLYRFNVNFHWCSALLIIKPHEWSLFFFTFPVNEIWTFSLNTLAALTCGDLYLIYYSLAVLQVIFLSF